MLLYCAHSFVFLVICNIKVMIPVPREVENAGANRAKGSIDKTLFPCYIFFCPPMRSLTYPAILLTFLLLDVFRQTASHVSRDTCAALKHRMRAALS